MLKRCKYAEHKDQIKWASGVLSGEQSSATGCIISQISLTCQVYPCHEDSTFGNAEEPVSSMRSGSGAAAFSKMLTNWQAGKPAP